MASSALSRGCMKDSKINRMRVVGVIPARYRSSRLDGKALADIHGKPMIQHVWERCRRAASLDQLLVATDDVRIQEAVALFGGEVVMTDPGHASGTDRVAEAVEDVECDVVVNIQGDEPMLDPLMIDELVEPFHADAGTEMVTLKQLITEEPELSDPNVVKVVSDCRGDALYFSRSLIPFLSSRAKDYQACKHLGPLRLLQRLFGEAFLPITDSAGANRAAGAVARAGERGSNPRRADKVAGARSLG